MMSPQTGRFLGATLLITGCCIGAGMLGLPVLTALGGFRSTLLMFTFSWLFMYATGLLFLEVNLWFDKEVNIVTMAEQTLGKTGKYTGWILFAFLFYSLMVAYIAGSGQLVTDFVLETFHYSLPEWIGSLAICCLFSLFLYFGTGTVDRFNRLLICGLVVTYFVLVGAGIPHIKFELLKHLNWSAAIFAIPAMIISFGYHNLVPSLTTYLKRDVKKLRLAILIGTLIPLLIYLMWESLILGLVPIEGTGGFREALDHGDMATRALRNAVGGSWIVDLAEYFAFFAIVTSLLSVALSFVDFLADGLHIKKDAKGKVGLILLSLTPPLFFGFLYPNIFLSALSYAGAFGAVTLFGILPVAMVWRGRYIRKLSQRHIIPGGKPVLLFILLFSLGVISIEIIHLIQG